MKVKLIIFDDDDNLMSTMSYDGHDELELYNRIAEKVIKSMEDMVYCHQFEGWVKSSMMQSDEGGMMYINAIKD